MFVSIIPVKVYLLLSGYLSLRLSGQSEAKSKICSPLERNWRFHTMFIELKLLQWEKFSRCVLFDGDWLIQIFRVEYRKNCSSIIINDWELVIDNSRSWRSILWRGSEHFWTMELWLFRRFSSCSHIKVHQKCKKRNLYFKKVEKKQDKKWKILNCKFSIQNSISIQETCYRSIMSLP